MPGKESYEDPQTEVTKQEKCKPLGKKCVMDLQECSKRKVDRPVRKEDNAKETRVVAITSRTFSSPTSRAIVVARI